MQSTSIRRSLGLVVVCLAATLGVLASDVAAQTVEETYDFELDEWIDLDIDRTPITLHRMRMARSGGGLASRVGRNERYDQQLELQLEFTNTSSKDWKCRIVVEWVDANGETIEGIETKLELDKHKARAIRNERSSANRYGIERAKKLKISVQLNPD